MVDAGKLSLTSLDSSPSSSFEGGGPPTSGEPPRLLPCGPRVPTQAWFTIDECPSVVRESNPGRCRHSTGPGLACHVSDSSLSGRIRSFARRRLLIPCVG